MRELKTGWKRVRFGEVVHLNKETSRDPAADGLDRYVGLEHIEPGDLRIRSWGNIADGTTFTNRFRPGHVLFGKRRAYQRKVAVVDFDGVCSGDIYVLEPRNSAGLLPDLLPFICQTDAFFEHAVGTSAGSLSPRTNWTSLADFEFVLPSLEEQRRIVAAASRWSVVVEQARSAVVAAYSLRDSMRLELTRSVTDWTTVAECIAFLTSGSRGWSKHYADSGDLFLRIGNLNSPTLRLNLSPEQFQCVDTPGGSEAERTRVHEGDVLLGITGEAGLGLVGYASQLPCPSYISQHIAMIRPDPARCDGRFLAHVLASPFGQHQVTRFNQPGAKAGMTLIDVRRLPVPLLPVEEQIESAQHVDDVEDAILALEGRVAQSNQVALEQVRLALMSGGA